MLLPDLIDFIERRYLRGLKNLFEFISLADRWIVADNSGDVASIIADGKSNVDIAVHYPELWSKIKLVK
ncbi:MAG TPA: hypothetical protein PLJ60_01310 [Chryseolinea sp.]|nr:hypothetical protein [Chryseolinea sp.]HPM28944.1 hypothetical protein [Chryseolinea sp.]